MLRWRNTVTVVVAILVATVGGSAMALNLGLFSSDSSEVGTFRVISGASNFKPAPTAEWFDEDDVAVTVTTQSARQTGDSEPTPPPVLRVTRSGVDQDSIEADEDVEADEADEDAEPTTTTHGRPVVSVPDETTTTAAVDGQSEPEPWWFDRRDPDWWGNGSADQFPSVGVATGDDD